ncbi:pyridoxamine 5'-phosphate oxidase-domain-containing protein [Phanerochaete sordida]|uniref:Pyridoxamine 5'-phosphate oxidase-domain-containing protein n=1 Tax=Phanerochaete sordida TaxID=48140 RepID=A0A9P3GAJ4_9APHY|nr:pyridoxamine 5'-phosphate oxidase-domain-containing protein [Phanerochaete sordida]
MRSLAAIFLFACAVLARETVEDAARLARQLVSESADAIGYMATTYPDDHETLPGQPFSLQEYYGSCHSNGSLTLLFMPIARHSQNVLRSPTHAAAISIGPAHPAASRARVALIGNVTVFADLAAAPERARIEACYLAAHPDARHWLPGPREPHIAYWARFDPHSIYFVGGFGSSHYIGYVPLELYQGAALGPEQGVAGRVLVDQSSSAL